jgi:hypothetical protein
VVRVSVITPAKARALGLAPETVGTLWNPSFPSDVTNEQARLRTAFTALNAALAASPPQGDPTNVNLAVVAYNALAKQISSYLAEDPAVLWWNRDDQVKRGQDFEAQLESWRVRFAGMSVAVPAAPAPTAEPKGSDPLGLGNVADTLKWAVVAFLAFKVLGK